MSTAIEKQRWSDSALARQKRLVSRVEKALDIQGASEASKLTGETELSVGDHREHDTEKLKTGRNWSWQEIPGQFKAGRNA